MNDPKIFFISSQRGMWCDFIAYQISQDPNYYQLNTEVNALNKYNTTSALTDWHDNLTFDLKSAREPEEARIASAKSLSTLSQFKEKHYVIQSHYCDDPLALEIPKVVPVRITSNKYYHPFFFLLGLIKVSWDVTGLAGDQPSIFFLGEKSNMKDHFALIRGKWILDHYNSKYKPKSYIELSLTDLLEGKPTENEWKEAFDLNKSINKQAFLNKWEKDFEVIKQTFGIEYDHLVKTNWLKAAYDRNYEVMRPFHPDTRLLTHFYKKALATCEADFDKLTFK